MMQKLMGERKAKNNPLSRYSNLGGINWLSVMKPSGMIGVIEIALTGAQRITSPLSITTP